MDRFPFTAVSDTASDTSSVLGTSNTRLATPSAPGGMIYSGPRNGTVVSVSDICSGGCCD